MKLVIGWLYPDLMSTYGDRGNIISLQKRCQWRDIEVEIKSITLESKGEELLDCDFLFMGGAQDRQQKIVSEDLRINKGPIIKHLIEGNLPGLFVCAAYQFFGRYYRSAEGEEIPGLGIFDLETVHPGKTKTRCIGNIVVRITNNSAKDGSASGGQLPITNYLVGFENHGGRTYLGRNLKPLGEVVVGYGNNGEDRKEGCVYKNAIGTYLHGPVLPKNPHLADFLIKLALSKKAGGEVELKKLEDGVEWKAHESLLAKLSLKGNKNE